MQLSRLRLFDQVKVLEIQQDFPLQADTGSLSKISDIFSAFSQFFVAVLFCCFVCVPWIQRSHLAIENTAEAQLVSRGACSG